MHGTERYDMNIKTQMIKGFLEGFVLKVLEKESLYTGDIIKKLSDNGLTNISEGTLYPLLLRLENSKFLMAKRINNPLGPSRKVYSITPLGVQELEKITDFWLEFNQICHRILGGNNDE